MAEEAKKIADTATGGKKEEEEQKSYYYYLFKRLT